MNETLHVGLDVGSTTVKIIVMDKNKNTLYKNYQRHFSDARAPRGYIYRAYTRRPTRHSRAVACRRDCG